METIEPIYGVTLDDGIMCNPLTPMSEQNLYGYLHARPLEKLTPEEVLARLEETGNITVYFEPRVLGLRTRVDIKRAV